MRPPEASSRQILNGRVIGKGPPLIIMHGLFGSSRNWLSHAKKISLAAEIHLLDLRNHGQSPWFDDMDYPLMAEDLKNYMDANRIDAAHIVGHSMGGKVAMQFALHHGDRVKRLIIADIAPVDYDHSYAPHIRALNDAPLLKGDRKAVEMHLQTVLQDDVVTSFLMQNLVRADEAYAWRVNVEAIAGALPALLGPLELNDVQPFEGEALFLRGSRSDYVRNEHRRIIRRLFPNATLAALKDAGHWLHAEQPDAFIKAMIGFLKLEI